jgi:hypothetical protein
MVRLPQLNILSSKDLLIPGFCDFIGSNIIHFSFILILQTILLHATVNKVSNSQIYFAAVGIFTYIVLMHVYELSNIAFFVISYTGTAH